MNSPYTSQDFFGFDLYEEQDPLEREVGYGMVTSDVFVAQSSEIDGLYCCN